MSHKYHILTIQDADLSELPKILVDTGATVVAHQDCPLRQESRYLIEHEDFPASTLTLGGSSDYPTATVELVDGTYILTAAP